MKKEEKTWGKPLGKILNISLPATVSMISSFSVLVVNTAFSGHLGNPAIMAGVGMAAMYCNIFCNSIVIGLNSTLNTLLS